MVSQTEQEGCYTENIQGREESVPPSSDRPEEGRALDEDYFNQDGIVVVPEENAMSPLTNNRTPPRPLGWGVRHTQALMVFLGLSVSFMIRLNLAVAVVGMEKSKTSELKLSPGQKAVAVSSLFLGYSILQVPAGTIGRKGYAIILFSVANILSGILCLFLPLAVFYFGVYGIIVSRVLTGMLQGFIYPNLNNIMANWVVPEESDALMCAVHTGNPFGSLLVMVMSGFLNEHFDWPSIFYATGVLGVICGILNYKIGRYTPDCCKNMSPEEKDYLKVCTKAKPDEDCREKIMVPWKDILRSKPVIALVVCAWCCYWGAWTLSILVPSYINGVLEFEMDDNGMLSALPYLLCCILSILISIIARYMKKNNLMPDKVTRPLWNSIGMLGACAPIAILAYIPVNAILAITLLTMSASLSVACNVGFMINHIDLSPRFSGVLMSIMNAVGNSASLFGPLISTYMIKDETSQDQWKYVFIICALLFFIGNAVFVFFGTTNKQPWDVGIRKEIVDLRTREL